MSERKPAPGIDVFDRILSEFGCWMDEEGNWHDPEDAVGNDGASTPYPSNDAGRIERARKYIVKMPRAVSGNNGHDAAWLAAQAMIRGFDLTKEEAWPILKDWSDECSPPWSDKELRHKIEDVYANSRMPRGYILARSRPQQASPRSRPERKEEDPDIEPAGSDEPMAFPVEAFPPDLQRFALEVAEALSCPVDFAAVAMLSIAASAIGTTRAIAVTRRWLECPRLYLAIVADPGDAKSPALDMVCDPLFRHQEEVARQWEESEKRYEIDRVAYEAKKRKVVAGKAHESLLCDKPKRPAFNHIYTTNSTTEALAAMLRDSPRGFVMVQDEITGWVQGMNQYKGGKGNDRQFWLSVWSGAKCKVDRKSAEQGPLIIHHPFVNVLGGIQPDMVDELCDEQARQDGFIHRMLFSYPQPKPWKESIGEAPSPMAEEAWAGAVGTLLTLQMTTNKEGNPVPGVVRISELGQEVMRTWYAEHAQERNDPEFPTALVGPWSKMRSYYFRLALTLHLLHYAVDGVDPDEVDENSLAGAAAIIEYFKSHARRVYGLFQTTREDKRLIDIVRWMGRKKNNPGTCTTRELVRARYAKKASQAANIFKELADRGHGTIREEDAGAGKVRTSFVMSVTEVCHKNGDGL